MVSSCLSSGLGFWGPSNRSAIGARVCLEAGGRKQYREVSGGSNFGCLPFEQHFGLAAIEKIDALQIRWPSGLIQRFADLPVNTTLRFTDGQGTWEPVYGEARCVEENSSVA